MCSIPLPVARKPFEGKGSIELSIGLAILDLVAIGFAGAEYFAGVPRFFPYSPVTLIMYASRDVAGGFLRIPSTFASAHAFGGTMVGSTPFLIGLWTGSENRFHRMLGLIALPAALLGVLMSATRTNFIFACAIMTFVFLKTRMKGTQMVIFLAVMGAVTFAALTNVRFQRFKSLDNTEYVSQRIAGSVNRNFFEILAEYPMGNGLGGGGTSIPYFLEGQVRNPIGMENEYTRILAEQGVIGICLWLAFLVWFLFRGSGGFPERCVGKQPEDLVVSDRDWFRNRLDRNRIAHLHPGNGADHDRRGLDGSAAGAAPGGRRAGFPGMDSGSLRTSDPGGAVARTACIPKNKSVWSSGLRTLSRPSPSCCAATTAPAIARNAGASGSPANSSRFAMGNPGHRQRVHRRHARSGPAVRSSISDASSARGE